MKDDSHLVMDPKPLLDKLSSGASVGALVLSLAIAFNTASSRFSLSDRRGEDNTAQLQNLTAQVATLQKQIDQDVRLQEQLKSLAEQNKITQQAVHDLTVNLESFESRFLVIPASSRH